MEIDDFLTEIYQKIKEFDVSDEDSAYWSYCLKLFGESLIKLEMEFELPETWGNPRCD